MPCRLGATTLAPGRGREPFGATHVHMRRLFVLRPRRAEAAMVGRSFVA